MYTDLEFSDFESLLTNENIAALLRIMAARFDRLDELERKSGSDKFVELPFEINDIVYVTQYNPDDKVFEPVCCHVEGFVIEGWSHDIVVKLSTSPASPQPLMVPYAQIHRNRTFAEAAVSVLNGQLRSGKLVVSEDKSEPRRTTPLDRPYRRK